MFLEFSRGSLGVGKELTERALSEVAASGRKQHYLFFLRSSVHWRTVRMN